MPVQKKATSFIATIDNVPETEKMAEMMRNMEDNIDNMSYSLKARYRQTLISQMSLLKSTNFEDPNFTMKQNIKYVEFNADKKPATQETDQCNNEKVRLKIEKMLKNRNTIPHENLSGNKHTNFNNKIERNLHEAKYVSQQCRQERILPGRGESLKPCKKENININVSLRSPRAKSKSPVTERLEDLVSDVREYINNKSPESRTRSPKRVTFDASCEEKGLSSDAIRMSEADETKPLKPIALAPVAFRRNDTTDESVRAIRNKTQELSVNKNLEPIPGYTYPLLQKVITSEPLLSEDNALSSPTENRQRASRMEMRTRSIRHVYDPQPSGVIPKLNEELDKNEIMVTDTRQTRNTKLIGKEGYYRDSPAIHNREMTRVGVSNGAVLQIPNHQSSMQGSVLHDNRSSLQTVQYQSVVESDELQTTANTTVAPRKVTARSARYAAGGQKQSQVPTSQVSIRSKTNKYSPENGIYNHRSLRSPPSFKQSYVVTPEEGGDKNRETLREDTTEHVPLCFTTNTEVRSPYIGMIDKCTVQTTMYFNKDGNETYEASEEETSSKTCYVPQRKSRQDMPNRHRNIPTLDQTLETSMGRHRCSCPPAGTGVGSPLFTSTPAGYGMSHKRAAELEGSQLVPLDESSLTYPEMSNSLPPTTTRRMLEFSNDSGRSGIDLDQTILTNGYHGNYHTDQIRISRDVFASPHGYTPAESVERDMCGNGRFGFDVAESQTLVLRRSDRLTGAVVALMDRFNEVVVSESMESPQRLRLQLEDLTRTTARLEMDIVSLSENNRQLAMSCAQEVRVAEEQLIASVQHGPESSRDLVRRVALLRQRAFMHGAVHQNSVHLTSLRDVLNQLKEMTVNISQRFESPLAQDNTSLPSCPRQTSLCYHVLDGAANPERLPVHSLE